MAYYYYKQEDPLEPLEIAVVTLLVIGWVVVMCVKAIYNAVLPWLIAAGQWMISFHFRNVFETLFHAYVWIVYVPVVLLILLGAAGVVLGVIYSVIGAIKLTGLIPFGEGWIALLGPLVVGFFLSVMALGVGGVLGVYLVLLPCMWCLGALWGLLCMFKDKVLKMSWCPNVLFGIMIYVIIPGLLLTGFILTK